MRRLSQGLLLTLALLLTAGPVWAANRVALVVGNSNYDAVADLANPGPDAKLMAQTLVDLGFTLVGGKEQLDLDKASLDAAVQKFGNESSGADVALFYYAGHGVQVRGANYLVPVSANPTREADVDFQMLDSDLVVRQMEGSGARLKLVILDACRNNPFGGRGLRSSSGGLAQMSAPEGTLISFATQPGNVALDGAGGNSPYTAALAATIRRPGLDIFRAFNDVGLAVAEATGGQQQPWFQLSPIKGNFYFAGEDKPASVPAPEVAALAEKIKKLEEELASQKVKQVQQAVLVPAPKPYQKPAVQLAPAPEASTPTKQEPAPKSVATTECQKLAEDWKAFYHSPVPEGFRKHLAYEGLATIPAKLLPGACEDADIYWAVRVQTYEKQRKLIVECGWKFGGGLVDASSLGKSLTREQSDFDFSKRKICNLAKTQAASVKKKSTKKK